MIGALAVVLWQGCVLLIERGFEPHLGHWSLPGGVIDERESAGEAAVRETLEETGFEVVVVRELGVIPGPPPVGGTGCFCALWWAGG